MRFKHILFLVTCMIFMPSCDKNEPIELDCIGRPYEYQEELPAYELEPLDEKDEWQESPVQAQKVEKEFKKRGLK